VDRAAPHLVKIAMPELIGNRDDGGAHRAVLVCSLRPGKAALGVHPQSESHAFS
jgi:hypothetical protein